MSYPDELQTAATGAPIERRTVLAGVGATAASALAPSLAAERVEVSPSYDAVIYGATPAGIVAAVRLARQGRSVLLVGAYPVIGGMFSNGLSMMDALYEGWRSPLYGELLAKLQAHYATQYGAGSDAAEATEFLPPDDFSRRPRFEAKVMRVLLEAWISGEPNITLRHPFAVARVDRAGAAIETAHFSTISDEAAFSARAAVFLDCSYEGDFLAKAGVSHVIGRESREDYDEPHAGQIFVEKTPPDDISGAMWKPDNMLPVTNVIVQRRVGGTGRGDRAVQAYNMRFVLSTDPGNRRPIDKPTDYDRELFAKLLRTRGADRIGVRPVPLMNGKVSSPAFADWPEHSWTFPEADWKQRRSIIDAHVNYGLGLLYFLQTDAEVPIDVRDAHAAYGLPLDEFVDNDNVPHEVYVREARRMRGRYIFTENDATPVDVARRPPIHSDAIALTDWMMDSHACTGELDDQGDEEGAMLLSEQTRPAQVPFRALLPREVENLLVPVCLSATHVGLGTLRVEPTLMHIAESAAWAADMALRENVPVSRVSISRLQARLTSERVTLSYFEDFDMGQEQEWASAIQYFGARGFFPGFKADPEGALLRSEAMIWIDAFRQDLNADAQDVSDRVLQARKSGGPEVSTAEFLRLAGSQHTTDKIDGDFEVHFNEPISRKKACLYLYRQAIRDQQIPERI